MFFVYEMWLKKWAKIGLETQVLLPAQKKSSHNHIARPNAQKAPKAAQKHLFWLYVPGQGNLVIKTLTTSPGWAGVCLSHPAF
jgi:hypothetical protein